MQTCVLYEYKQIYIVTYDIKLGNCKHYNKVTVLPIVTYRLLLLIIHGSLFHVLTFITKNFHDYKLYSILVFIVTKICQNLLWLQSNLQKP